MYLHSIHSARKNKGHIDRVDTGILDTFRDDVDEKFVTSNGVNVDFLSVLVNLVTTAGRRGETEAAAESSCSGTKSS